MKAPRCKYGHKIECKTSIITKIRDFNYEKFFVLTTVAAFMIYCGYLNIWS